MTRININEVKSRLSYYSRRVKSGETFILCERNKPFAELRPLAAAAQAAPKREIGVMKGWFPVPANFNEPDPELEHCIEKGPIFPPVATSAPASRP